MAASANAAALVNSLHELRLHRVLDGFEDTFDQGVFGALGGVKACGPKHD
jgi:hypothetical protein